VGKSREHKVQRAKFKAQSWNQKRGECPFFDDCGWVGYLFSSDFMYLEGVTPTCSLKASMNFDLEANPALEEMASSVNF
jgi:hypothetical protein